jgi:hypothetical protein
MGAIREASNRVLSFFHKQERHCDLEAEFQSHIDLAVEENISHGMPPDEARRRALVRIGGVQQAKRSSNAPPAASPGSTFCCRISATRCAPSAATPASQSSPSSSSLWASAPTSLSSPSSTRFCCARSHSPKRTASCASPRKSPSAEPPAPLTPPMPSRSSSARTNPSPTSPDTTPSPRPATGSSPAPASPSPSPRSMSWTTSSTLWGCSH